MTQHCRVTQDEIRHDQSQANIACGTNLVREDRYREDRELVRANAALLMAKVEVTAMRTQWRGDVYLGSKEWKWDYLDVVGRASECDEYYGHVIDLTADDFTTRLTAGKKLAEITKKAALEIAFDSLDIGDLWLDVDELMDWEPGQ